MGSELLSMGLVAVAGFSIEAFSLFDDPSDELSIVDNSFE
jgi:hypothetical protein